MDEEVHLQRPLEVVVCDRKEPIESDPHGADVVDQDIDAAESADCAIDQLPGCTRGRQVDRNRRDSIKPFKAARRARSGHHMSPFLYQRLGDREPMPRPAPVTTATLSSSSRSTSASQSSWLCDLHNMTALAR